MQIEDLQKCHFSFKNADSIGNRSRTCTLWCSPMCLSCPEHPYLCGPVFPICTGVIRGYSLYHGGNRAWGHSWRREQCPLCPHPKSIDPKFPALYQQWLGAASLQNQNCPAAEGKSATPDPGWKKLEVQMRSLAEENHILVQWRV